MPAPSSSTEALRGIDLNAFTRAPATTCAAGQSTAQGTVRERTSMRMIGRQGLRRWMAGGVKRTDAVWIVYRPTRHRTIIKCLFDESVLIFQVTLQE